MAIGFVAYLAVIAVIAGFALVRTKTAGDYVIGGRSLPPSVAGLSAGASDMSGWLLLGLPGAVFVAGLGEGWIVLGLACGAWASWRWVAPRLRAFTERLDGAVTLPQFFSRRVASRTGLPGIVATLLILFFFAIYTAASFVAGARLFETTIGMDYEIALAIGVGVVLAYTLVGGFLAASWTDFFQALLMMAALVVVAALAFVNAPSLAGGVKPMGLIAVVSALAWGLGYFGQPHFLARFMAINRVESVPRARRINLVWMVVASTAAVGVGLGGDAYFGGALDDPETVFIALSSELLAPWLAGIVVAGILAAVMSTVDSQLLVASTALVEDVVRPIWRRLDALRAPVVCGQVACPTTVGERVSVLDRTRWVRRRPSATRLDERWMLPLSRVSVIVVALVGAWIATDPASRVFELAAYAWAGLGASFGPAALACVLWRRTTEAGLVAGMLTGGIVTIVWKGLSGGPWGIFDLYEIVPAFAAAGIAIVVVSQLGDQAGRRERAIFDRLAG